MSSSSSALRDVLATSAVELAPRLLGARLTHVDAQGLVTVRISEVEAYLGNTDPGSHAYRGKTPRNAVMFGPVGYVYMYLSYGMHYCANVVCGPDGAAQAILFRAGEVVEGEELARRRRPAARTAADLASGPARLAQALGLTLAHGGADLVTGEVPGSGRGAQVSASRLALTLARPSDRPDSASILSGPRVGVSGPGGDGEMFPWRFWISGDPTVSRYRRATQRNASARARGSVGSHGPSTARAEPRFDA